jgi:hypothetical protein
MEVNKQSVTTIKLTTNQAYDLYNVLKAAIESKNPLELTIGSKNTARTLFDMLDQIL